MIKFLRIIQDFVPLIGGVAGLASFMYTFLVRRKKIELILPQQKVFLINEEHYLIHYHPDGDIDETYFETNVVLDLCLINDSSLDRVIYSIKLVHHNNVIDLNRHDLHHPGCFEVFEGIPMKVLANSSILFKASFSLKNINLQELSDLRIEVYYQKHKSTLNLKHYECETEHVLYSQGQIIS